MQGNALNDSAAGPYKVNSLRIDPRADPMTGVVSWDPWRSLWNGGMLVGAVVLAPRYFTWGAFAVFFVLLEITMCTGHSVGFHRRLIHRTF
jgi:stearoyl-CoA desaturase (delta-9 desaturase)